MAGENNVELLQFMAANKQLTSLPLITNIVGDGRSPEAVENLANGRRRRTGSLRSITHPASARHPRRRRADGLGRARPRLPGGLGRLLTKMAKGLHDAKLELWLQVPVGEEKQAFDIDTLSEQVDYFVAALHDQISEEDPPGPIAAQDWFGDWLDAIASYGDPDQWVIALGAYGYDWAEDARRDNQDRLLKCRHHFVCRRHEPRRLRRRGQHRERRAGVQPIIRLHPGRDRSRCGSSTPSVFLNQSPRRPRERLQRAGNQPPGHRRPAALDRAGLDRRAATHQGRPRTRSARAAHQATRSPTSARATSSAWTFRPPTASASVDGPSPSTDLLIDRPTRNSRSTRACITRAQAANTRWRSPSTTDPTRRGRRRCLTSSSEKGATAAFFLSASRRRTIQGSSGASPPRAT